MAGPAQGTILYGMMGAGKTTLGEGLAAHLNQSFIDTDQLIEQRFGQTCAQIIKRGDFGARQEEAIRAYSPTLPEVVATGGSVATYPNCVRHLARFGVGIFIDVDPEELETRLPSERIAVLNNPKGLSFGELYRERAESYRAVADFILSVASGELVEASLTHIIELRTSASH